MRLLIALPVVAIGLALAGCGESENGTGSGSTNASNREKAQDAMFAWARCMRENGIDMPDPEIDGSGRVRMGPGRGAKRPSQEKMEAAERKCEKHRQDLGGGPEPTAEQKEEMLDQALKHARCMRENGVDNFPDPQVSKDGGVTMRIGPDSGINPDSPRFRKAQEACEKALPKPPGDAQQEGSTE